MNFSYKDIFTGGLLLSLAACGGGGTSSSSNGGGTGPGLPAESPSYLTLAAQSGGTSQIAGAVLATNSNTGNITTGAVSGTLKHWNGKLTISNGVATFTSTGPGLQLGGVTQGTDASTLTTNSTLDSGFQYLTVFQSHGPAGGNGLDALGVMGIATGANHIPTSGSATYTGAGEAILVTQSDGTVVLTEGDATLSVNFATGIGNLTLDQFTASDASGTTLSGSPITKIKVLQMNVSGNALTGGNLVFNTNTSPSEILGDNATMQAQGQFFGHTGVHPAEVGGVINASGDTGHLNGLYVVE